MRVAIIGMGRMGAAMARRIAAEGDHDLIVFNRSRRQGNARSRQRWAAQHAESVQAAVQAADVVLVSLADDAAVFDTYRGDDGICSPGCSRARRVRHEHGRSGHRAVAGS